MCFAPSFGRLPSFTPEAVPSHGSRSQVTAGMAVGAYERRRHVRCCPTHVSTRKWVTNWPPSPRSLYNLILLVILRSGPVIPGSAGLGRWELGTIPAWEASHRHHTSLEHTHTHKVLSTSHGRPHHLSLTRGSHNAEKVTLAGSAFAHTERKHAACHCESESEPVGGACKGGEAKCGGGVSCVDGEDEVRREKCCRLDIGT
jgi:hypothetical protein